MLLFGGNKSQTPTPYLPGVEESGRLIIGQPGFGPHLISLFAVGPNPLSATNTLEEHLGWVNDPLHSYVQDGTGCLCIWAHPGARDAGAILNISGLASIELHHGGNSAMRDSLCYFAKPFIDAQGTAQGRQESGKRTLS